MIVVGEFFFEKESQEGVWGGVVWVKKKTKGNKRKQTTLFIPPPGQNKQIFSSQGHAGLSWKTGAGILRNAEKMIGCE